MDIVVFGAAFVNFRLAGPGGSEEWLGKSGQGAAIGFLPTAYRFLFYADPLPRPAALSVRQRALASYPSITRI
jgi:hypothetical protein